MQVALRAERALRPRLTLEGSAAVGTVLWAATVAALLPGWGAAMLLLAVLALVPLGLALVPVAERPAWWPVLLWAHLPCALLLVGAFALPPGISAGLLAVPWCGYTAVIGLLGVQRRWRAGFGAAAGLCFDMGLIYLPVGGGWAVLSRLGLEPLAFSPVIVQATAVHFHYAGFVLPLLTGLAARALPGWFSKATALGVVAGVPLVAAGITASKLTGVYGAFELIAALLMASAGLGAAVLHLRLVPVAPTARTCILATTAGTALFAGMVLAAVYALGMYTRAEWLDIPTMLPWHGGVNALGFALPGLLAWNRGLQPPSIDDPGENRHLGGR